MNNINRTVIFAQKRFEEKRYDSILSYFIDKFKDKDPNILGEHFDILYIDLNKNYKENETLIKVIEDELVEIFEDESINIPIKKL